MLVCFGAGLKSISSCRSLSSLKLGICLNITDRGLSYIGMGCSNLRELDLYRSVGITDIGISSIAQGCCHLETINISYCKDITDKSLVSLSKCSMLQTFESRGCPHITCQGLAAIAVRCKRLTKLDLKKCPFINDSGLLTLAHFSQGLKQVKRTREYIPLPFHLRNPPFVADDLFLIVVADKRVGDGGDRRGTCVASKHRVFAEHSGSEHAGFKPEWSSSSVGWVWRFKESETPRFPQIISSSFSYYPHGSSWLRLPVERL